MKRASLIATALVLAVVAVLTTRVMAQTPDTRDLTYLTFSNTVELPGVTLPAGTYTFRLADTPSRNVVQVLDKDQKTVMGQWLFAQAERPDAVNDTMIMFKEQREGSTPAVQFWFYPGERIGKEFIYPKNQAEKIAARTGQQVRSDEGYVTASASSTDAKGETTQWQREATPSAPPLNSANGVQGGSVSDNSPADSTLRNAPASSQPTAAAGSLTGNRGVSPQASNDRQDLDRDIAVTDNRHAAGTSGSSQNGAVGTSGVEETGRQARASELPKTGSGLPLAALIGLLSLAGAGVSRMTAVRR